MRMFLVFVVFMNWSSKMFAKSTLLPVAKGQNEPTPSLFSSFILVVFEPSEILGFANPLGATSLQSHARAGGRMWSIPKMP